MRCPSCGADAPEGAKFCPSCGRSLVAHPDERRVVTVLFADLVGFTSLAETRDPEQIKNLVDGWFARLADDVRAFGGNVDKVLGDALVAIFGAPVAHEDDAERAVRAALQMQRTLAAQTAAAGLEVGMRIGVNTGEVLVGAMRAGGDPTVMGDVVNIASRLQTAAEPGTVVVGAETHAASDGTIRYEPLGLLQAKGRHGAVEAWRAIEPVLAPGRRRPRRRSPLIGRDADLAAVIGFVHDAFTERRPSLALIVGEAGIGKSRLVEEVLDIARSAYGALVLSGRAVPYGASNDWWPIVEIMRGACGITSADDPVSARRKCEETVASVGITGDEGVRLTTGLSYLLGIDDGAVNVDVTRARDEVSRGIRTLLSRLAELRPLLLVLADAQWADDEVLHGVDDLVSRLTGVPLVCLLSARPELTERWHPSDEIAQTMTLELQPLSPDAAAELLTTLLGHDPGPVTRAELVERSGGNPLFVEELAAVVEQGGGAAVLPATLRGIVAARLDALPPDERAALEDAAVLGRRAPVAAVLVVGDGRPGEKEALRSLAAQELLDLVEEDVEFRSDLVREVVYAMLTKGERARRHARLAAWLERVEEGSVAADEVVGEAARHWLAAAEVVDELGPVPGVPEDVRDRAVDALLRAGSRAEGRELHEPAYRAFGTALRLVGDRPGAPRLRALIGRGVAATALGLPAVAESDIDAAVVESRAAGDDLHLARALTARGDLQRTRGELEASLSSLEEARALWRFAGNDLGEASTLRRIGWTLLYAGRLRDAERVLLEALAAFRDGGEERGEAWALQQLAWVAFGRGQLDLAEERLLASTERFRQLGDWGGLSWAGNVLAWVRFRQRRVEEAATLAVEAHERAEQLADVEQVARATVLLTAIRLWQGRIDEAVVHGGEALAAFEEAEDEWGEAQAVAPLMGALVLAGRFDDARRLGERSAARARSHPGLQAFVAPASLAAAHAAVSVGAADEALRAAERAERADAVFVSVDLPSAKAMALLQLGRVEDALDVVARNPAAPDLGPAHALALVAVGDDDRAEAVADEVLESTSSSYRSRILALLARAAAAARRGRADAAHAGLDEARTAAAATSDRIIPVVVETGALAVARILGEHDGQLAATVEQGYEALGLTYTGWQTLFAAVTGASAATA